jgi:hypothetical protein
MIPVEQIARLAEIFDRYNNALDPFALDCLSAKREFDEFSGQLHAVHAPEVKFPDFRYELVRHCRDYLRKNRPL